MIELDTKAEVERLTKELGLLIAQYQQLERQIQALAQEISGKQAIVRYLQSLNLSGEVKECQ